MTRDYVEETKARKESNKKYGLIQISLTVPADKSDVIKKICTDYTRKRKFEVKMGIK